MLAAGEFARVREHLEIGMAKSVDARIASGGEHDLYAMLVDAAVRERDAEELTRYVPLAEETASSTGHALYQAIADRGRAVLFTLQGNYPEAQRRLDKAEAVFKELGTRWQVGRCQFEHGLIAQAQHDYAAARDHLTRAAEIFDALGAAPFVAQARTALAHMG